MITIQDILKLDNRITSCIVENPDEDSARLNLVKTTISKKIDIFLSNSFGFGGTNSALVVKKFKHNDE